VTLPWGDLLEGLALAEPDVLAGLPALAKPGARLRLVLNGGPWSSNAPKRTRRLPELTPGYVWAKLADRYAAHSVTVKQERPRTEPEIAGLHSTWAKRLGHGRDRLDLTFVDGFVR